MKRIMSWAIIGLFFASLATACGSSKAKCDAYGHNFDIQMEESSDLAQH